MTERFEDAERIVVRDKRRIDASGAVREPDVPEVPEPAEPVEPAQPGPPPAPAVSLAQLMIEERTADLQRIKAEFDNYRKRVERDRAATAEQAVAGVLVHLLPVLDDIDRAREHGEVTGGFKSVADSLEAALAKLGLERFGAVGDPFDPSYHEAVTHQHSDEVTEATCVGVMRPGYKFADRLLRPAMVAVAEPG